jgi:hypothetical protein
VLTTTASISAISCPSASICIAAADDGRILVARARSPRRPGLRRGSERRALAGGALRRRASGSRRRVPGLELHARRWRSA